MATNIQELRKIQYAEKRMQLAAEREPYFDWQARLKEKIPPKAMNALETGFSKAFYLVFDKGVGIIDRTYNKKALQDSFGQKSFEELKKEAGSAHLWNTLATTIDGVGLGLLGIGVPDIIIWVATLLRGVYETAVRYGYDYDTDDEKMFILKMIENAMTSGEQWAANNEELDEFICSLEHKFPSSEEIKTQIDKTARAFATQMLISKFIQTLPLVGVFGGAANPVYYQKVMKYVQLKYHKRYLLDVR